MHNIHNKDAHGFPSDDCFAGLGLETAVVVTSICSSLLLCCSPIVLLCLRACRPAWPSVQTRVDSVPSFQASLYSGFRSRWRLLRGRADAEPLLA